MNVIARLMNGSPVGAVGAKLMGGSPVAEGLARIGAQRTARTGELAAAHAAVDALKEERQSRIEAGLSIDEVRSKILAARFELKRLASRYAEEEKSADEETAALAARGNRITIAAVEAEREKAQQDLANAGEEYIVKAIDLSAAVTKWEKAEAVLHAIDERLATLGQPVSQENHELPVLLPRLLALDPAAKREVSLGEYAYRWRDLSLPITTIDRRVPAVEQGNAVAATA